MVGLLKHAPMTQQLYVLFFSIFFVTIRPSTPARTPNYRYPETAGTDRTITFTMNDVLGSSHQRSVPVAGDVDDARIPPPEPMAGLFPASTGGRAGSALDHQAAATFSAIQGGDSGGWIRVFASSKDLEAGKVTTIDVDLTGNFDAGTATGLLGKAQGIYVTTLGDDDDVGNIVAMKVAFGNGGSEDSLRLFGVHRPGQSESHVAVVGGDGRYRDANGYAVLKTVVVKAKNEESVPRSLCVAVHLK